MKTLLSFGAMLGVLSLAVAPTIAQTQTTSTSSNTTYIETSKFIGKPVKSSQGEEIGTVKDVVLDRNTGCMAYTVLSTTGGGGGGVSGGGKMVAVPWTVYSPTSDLSALTVTVDQQRIYNAPVFDYARIEEYSRPDYISNVYSYYGVSPGAAVGVGVSGSTTTTGATTTTGTATGGAARPGATTTPGAGATTSPGAAMSPAPSGSPAAGGSPIATVSPTGRASASPNATAATSPRVPRGGRAHETASPSTRGGATGGTSPAEGTRGTRERREGTTPPSGRGGTESRPETERPPSEASSPDEKATGSQRRERGGKREATPPPERQ